MTCSFIVPDGVFHSFINRPSSIGTSLWKPELFRKSVHFRWKNHCPCESFEEQCNYQNRV